MTCHYDNPWIFHRDEIDLLEEEMDEIYRKFDPASGEPVLYMEDQVLKEQIETEEQSEADLILELGPEYLLWHEHHECKGPITPEESMVDMLRSHSHRDPFYERLYLWADRVFRFAWDRYEETELKSLEVFRVYVNVKMIPIKFVLTQTHQMSGSIMSRQIAKKERNLCFTYFQRTLESLNGSAFFGSDESGVLIAEGKLLERLLKKL